MIEFTVTKLQKGDAPPLDVVFIAAIAEDEDEAYLLTKRGWDSDLLESQYLMADCGLILPEGDDISGVYRCTNLRVVNYHESSNPENPEVSYDLECDWKRILDFNQALEASNEN
jgi:hypothetical protein